MAEPPNSRGDHALRRSSPRTPEPALTTTQATSRGTYAPSKSSSTATAVTCRRRTAANPGSTTTSATAGAPPPSSSGAGAGIACARCDFYTPMESSKGRCWRRKTTCRRCWPISRSPTMNAPPSTTGRPPSTSSSNTIQAWASTRRCQSHRRDLDERARRLRPARAGFRSAGEEGHRRPERGAARQDDGTGTIDFMDAAKRGLPAVKPAIPQTTRCP